MMQESEPIITGAAVVAEARTWLGTRWKHQGRNREGVDCAGLVIKVGHALDVLHFDTADYGVQATDESMFNLCREHLLPVTTPQPGDIVVFRFGGNRHMGFFGNYAHGGLSLIHAFTYTRRVVEHRFSQDWLRSHNASLMAVFRFPGVEAA